MAGCGLIRYFNYLLPCRDLDPGISEAVCALIYAAPRVDVTELTAIREQLINKFGKELLDRINNNALECVNPRVLLLPVYQADSLITAELFLRMIPDYTQIIYNYP